MGSMTDRVERPGACGALLSIRRMFDLTPRVPGAISLAVGEPGFATPPHIVEAGCQALRDGFTKYSPNPGYLELREAMAEKLERVNGYRVDPGSEVFVTVGAMQALALHVHGRDRPGRRGPRDRTRATRTSTRPSRWRGDGRSSCPRIPSADTSRTPRTWRPRSPRGRARSSSTARRTRRAPSTARDLLHATRRAVRPPRPPADLRRDVRGPDVRRHPERQPGVVRRPRGPDHLDLLLLEGVRDDGLAHRLPHGPGSDAGGHGARPGGDGLLRPLGDPAGGPRGHPRAAGLRRDHAPRLPAAARPGGRADEPGPRRSLPAARRGLLRVPRRPGGDPRHAAPRRTAALRPQGRRARRARRSVRGRPASCGSPTPPPTTIWRRA